MVRLIAKGTIKGRRQSLANVIYQAMTALLVGMTEMPVHFCCNRSM